MDYMTFEEFKTLPEYKNFIMENSDTGTLKINAYTADGVIPLEDTHILILKKINNYMVLFYEGLTNAEGIIDNIVLPTPKRVLNNIDIPLYTMYELSAIHMGYEDIEQYSIAMFGNTKIIQYVRLKPEVKSNV